MSRFQVAECLAAHPTTVAKWEREGLPVAERGVGGRPSKYSLPEVLRWYVARLEARLRETAGTLNLDAERAGLARIQTRKTELEVRRRQGELVTVAEVAAVWTELLTTVRAQLLAIPTGSAVAVADAGRDGGPRAVEAALRERILVALRELAAWRPPATEAPA